ncbi:hypothetical protein Dsin_002961 [Dipteronia sinensis]|uniref:Reverse transcriptase zinc-binding domain-containing protein n=1 Tax=Dipteronia sinensis TaxID=43782 RepID=A0AAE0B881_9ROSI|nr:hypothetical protein Dsin_002961 [Dipteronia sinensis]
MIEPSNISPRSSWWNTFWRVKIPMKVKMFIWKACQDWIPTKIDIGRRGVPTNGVCEACKCSAEDTLHTLWYCSKLNCIRAEWCDNMTMRAKKHNMSEVVNWSTHFLQEFQSSRPQLQRDVDCSNGSTCRWIPPEPDAYKANCDVMLDHGNGMTGIGVIIRNSSWLVLAFCSLVSEGPLNAKVAKLMAYVARTRTRTRRYDPVRYGDTVNLQKLGHGHGRTRQLK